MRWKDSPKSRLSQRSPSCIPTMTQPGTSLSPATIRGAARIVVVGESPESEQILRSILLRKFPRHLLGSVPLLYSWELVGDRDRGRRTWSSILNSFLHPVMERFLYQAQHRLREHKVTNPLLVYRNDGASSRVSKVRRSCRRVSSELVQPISGSASRRDEGAYSSIHFCCVPARPGWRWTAR